MLSAIDFISELIEQQEFAEAAQRLRSMRTEVSNLHDDRSAAVLLYYSARCHYHLGRYEQCLISTKAALRVAKRLSDDSLYGCIKQLCGLVFRSLGRIDDAIEAYSEALAFKKRAGENSGNYGTLVNIGLLRFQKGSVQSALESLDLALSNAKRYNTLREVFVCRYNTALVKLFAGEFRESSAFVNTIEQEGLLPAELGHLAILAGMNLAMRLNFPDADKHLKAARSTFAEKGIDRSQAVCLEYLGLNEYFAGNYAKAREYYDQVLAMPEPTASAVAQTLRMLTDVEIAEGNWNTARETAGRAEIAINKISERIELGALWRAYGHLQTHDGNHAVAREYFEKSIDLLRQLGARYELALSHFDAGRSACYSSEQRLEQLRQAKTLFVEMDVPKRVAQVDEALAALVGSMTSRNQSSSGQKSLTLKSVKPAPVVIAKSKAMLDVIATADRFKDSEMTILLTGETGTGKDLLAEYIHYSSHRASRPYKAINCAAIPESLLESELFGFKKGTYTGAGADKPGLIESADGGCFFFDEIGDAPLVIQAKLLRVIETKTVRRLGDNQDITVDVRFIAATNHDLKSRIEAKTFRSDLFYRLAQVVINLPPLRERREDIIPLLETFLAAAGVTLTAEDRNLLLAHPSEYSWPGNVRELIAIAARVATLQDDSDNHNIVNLLLRELGNESPEAVERQRLFTALQHHKGNKSKAADALGIPRTTLISQLKKFNL